MQRQEERIRIERLAVKFLGVTLQVLIPRPLLDLLPDFRPGLFEFIHGNTAEWRLGIPLGRLAEPSDQAALAVFLAGDGARHITGQDLAVDGGQTVV